MRVNRAVAAYLAVTVLLTACATGWRRIPIEKSLSLPQNQQAEVWRGGHASRLHGLVVLADSVRGIPFQEPLTCSSCQVTIPRADVDSVRVFESDVSVSQFVVITAFAAAFGYFILRWRYAN